MNAAQILFVIVVMCGVIWIARMVIWISTFCIGLVWGAVAEAGTIIIDYATEPTGAVADAKQQQSNVVQFRGRK